MIDWRHWHNEPYLVGGIVAAAWLYALATGPLRARFAPESPYPRKEAIRFYSGLVLFYLAVGSPLDQIGERFLLSAHMIQHALLIYPAALLFLIGLPPWFFRPSAEDRDSSSLGWLLHPVSCGLIFVITLSVWHVPAIYDRALQDKLIHVLEHLMFFGSALFYWWPVASPSRRHPPISHPGKMLYLVAVTIGMTPLFAFLAFSTDVLYPTSEYAPRIIANFSPAQDQLLGAAIMKLGGMGVTFIVFAVVFTRWYRSTELRRG